jgi:hypothetical protein
MAAWRILGEAGDVVEVDLATMLKANNMEIIDSNDDMERCFKSWSKSNKMVVPEDFIYVKKGQGKAKGVISPQLLVSRTPRRFNQDVIPGTHAFIQMRKKKKDQTPLDGGQYEIMESSAVLTPGQHSKKQQQQQQQQMGGGDGDGGDGGGETSTDSDDSNSEREWEDWVVPGMEDDEDDDGGIGNNHVRKHVYPGLGANVAKWQEGVKTAGAVIGYKKVVPLPMTLASSSSSSTVASDRSLLWLIRWNDKVGRARREKVGEDEARSFAENFANGLSQGDASATINSTACTVSTASGAAAAAGEGNQPERGGGRESPHFSRDFGSPEQRLEVRRRSATPPTPPHYAS